MSAAAAAKQRAAAGAATASGAAAGATATKAAVSAGGNVRSEPVAASAAAAAAKPTPAGRAGAGAGAGAGGAPPAIAGAGAAAGAGGGGAGVSGGGGGVQVTGAGSGATQAGRQSGAAASVAASNAAVADAAAADPTTPPVDGEVVEDTKPKPRPVVEPARTDAFIVITGTDVARASFGSNLTLRESYPAAAGKPKAAVQVRSRTAAAATPALAPRLYVGKEAVLNASQLEMGQLVHNGIIDDWVRACRLVCVCACVRVCVRVCMCARASAAFTWPCRHHLHCARRYRRSAWRRCGATCVKTCCTFPVAACGHC